MRCGFLMSLRFMPHNSGQRQGLLRKSLEMSHRVSPLLTVWLSGALGASSLSGTPFWATSLAVCFWAAEIGKFCAHAPGAAKVPASAAKAASATRDFAIRCVVIGCESVNELDKLRAILRSSP